MTAMTGHTTHWSLAGVLHPGPVDDCPECLETLP